MFILKSVDLKESKSFYEDFCSDGRKTVSAIDFFHHEFDEEAAVFFRGRYLLQ